MKNLKHIKRFNESDENLNITDVRSSIINESDESDENVRVKDIISFLQKYDSETPVYLKSVGGWPNNTLYQTKIRKELWGERYKDGMIDTEYKIRFLIDDSNKKYLMINNTL